MCLFFFFFNFWVCNIDFIIVYKNTRKITRMSLTFVYNMSCFTRFPAVYNSKINNRKTYLLDTFQFFKMFKFLKELLTKQD